MSCVNIRGCCIGEGRPKVIIPIVEPTETAVLEKAAEFSTLRADCVEWRIDCFEGAKDLPTIVHCAAKLRVALKDKLLLFTFRTKAEGGKAALAHEEYLHFIRTVLATDCADLIDIEFFTVGAELPALIEEAHTAGAAVVCSSHDFHKTPPRAELVTRAGVYRCGPLCFTPWTNGLTPPPDGQGPLSSASMLSIHPSALRQGSYRTPGWGCSSSGSTTPCGRSFPPRRS